MKWSCIVEFLRHRDTVTHRILGMDVFVNLIEMVNSYLDSVSDPLIPGVPRGFICVKSGDPEPQVSGVRIIIAIELEKLIREQAMQQKKQQAA